tara:strand:+ start:3240 stop:4055 length:816 start_codon:yes stop_codon:yes gene_type:complete
MKHNVILMQTGLETITTKETIQEMLPDANIIVVSESDRVPWLWQELLAYHDVESSGIAEEEDFIDSKVTLLHDNVVLHPNAIAILEADIPNIGDTGPFVLEKYEDGRNGPEVDAKIDEINEKHAEIAEEVLENNYPYLHVPIVWWEKPRFMTQVMQFYYGDTKHVWQGWDAVHDMESDQDKYYADTYKGVVWPMSTGSVVYIADDSGKEEQWEATVKPTFPTGFNPRDKFTSSLEYSEEMHKPFFSLEEGLNQHVAIVFYDEYHIIDGMPL